MATPIRTVHGRWQHYFDHLQFSSQEFYALVEEGIKQRKVPKARLFRVKFFQDKGMWQKREYLRVKNEDYIFDICAAPYGTGFFVSWWHGESSTLLYRFIIKIPFIGPFIETLLSFRTYYQLDSAGMFEECIKKSVMEAIDGIANDKGLRMLGEGERQGTTMLQLNARGR